MTTGLLTSAAAERIITTCRTAIGDSLRSVTYFTRDDYEQLYLREDLERDADLSTFIGHEWRGFKTVQTAYERSELGEYNYTIRVFDNGFLLRVTTERKGVIITTDGLTLKDFEEVATALDTVLSDVDDSA
ncbi:uncharacterized protein Nmag_2262 [Natrialba magadii ATCC 43099]|uniref:Uncharacterized protein n=1 Tax=Natrialba magadii (strain ATCC 43099 / DSM 3394 / CCM 3739 / CIP 104546 / IAM 13178 / JCM 8861 / NBRC 102185 / NCIMB 2190 / MS3) TaxID=547559 RepID=D3SWU5_NATMM|nr:hypothetical protein [Natrialba magadii]ADD05827.1 uncharacterized protein Nmag_2262 [Natrialba magadii ATCC 43099]ELY30097.1 hypothetical protein C500_09094 [Natrialba magadii ATCC 43099]